MSGMPLKLFALSASADLGAAVAAALKVELAAHEEREFEDGEHKARPLDDVTGADVYVVHSLHGGPKDSANDKLCRLLFFIGAVKDAGAARVTAVAPYLCLCAQGPAHQAERSADHALCRRHVRERRHATASSRSTCTIRRRSKMPSVAARLRSPPRRCSSITSGRLRRATGWR